MGCFSKISCLESNKGLVFSFGYDFQVTLPRQQEPPIIRIKTKCPLLHTKILPMRN